MGKVRSKGLYWGSEVNNSAVCEGEWGGGQNDLNQQNDFRSIKKQLHKKSYSKDKIHRKRPRTILPSTGGRRHFGQKKKRM